MSQVQRPGGSIRQHNRTAGTSLASLTIPGACLLLSLAPAPAVGELSTFGKMQAETYTETVGGQPTRSGLRFAPVNNRFGIKGSYDLGAGLKSIYQVTVKPRSSRPCENGLYNTFGGIAGEFGTLLIGPHDSPTMISTGKTHFNSHTLASPCDLVGAAGEDHTGLYYISPSFEGLQFAQLLPFSNDLVTHDIALIYKNGPWYLSAADQELTMPDGLRRYKSDLAFSILDWDGFTFGLYYSWLRRGEAEGADGLFAWPTGQAPERESWRLEYGYNFGNNMIKVQTGAVTEGDDGRQSHFSTVVVDYNYSKRTRFFMGQMRTVTEAPGRPPQEQITETQGLIRKF